jgi:exonuclease SbcD
MRILHTSDWHLGQELHEYSRGPEHDVFLEWLVQQVRDTDADALVVTGDVYDFANPPVDAQQRLYHFLRDALSSSPHLQIVIVGGNHDSAARIELPKELVDQRRVFLIGAMPRKDGNLHPASVVLALRDRSGMPAVTCAAVPFLRPGDFAATDREDDAVGSLYASVLEAAKQRAGNLPIMVTGHLNVSGGVVSDLSERRVLVGGQEVVSTGVFSPEIAYVALGHLHKPQLIGGRTIIRYAGSPFPMSIAERNYEHSVALLEFEGGKVSTSLIRTPRPTPFLRVPEQGAAPLTEIELALSELEIGKVQDHFRPFLEVAITLEAPEPDLHRRIETALGGKPVRIARIVRYASGGGQDLGEGDSFPEELAQIEPARVFSRKYAQEFGGDPGEEMNEAFAELLSGVMSEELPTGGSS